MHGSEAILGGIVATDVITSTCYRHRWFWRNTCNSTKQSIKIFATKVRFTLLNIIVLVQATKMHCNPEHCCYKALIVLKFMINFACLVPWHAIADTVQFLDNQITERPWPVSFGSSWVCVEHSTVELEPRLCGFFWSCLTFLRSELRSSTRCWRSSIISSLYCIRCLWMSSKISIWSCSISL